MWNDRKRVLVTLKYGLIFGIIVATNQVFRVRVRMVHNRHSDSVLQTESVVELYVRPVRQDRRTNGQLIWFQNQFIKLTLTGLKENVLLLKNNQVCVEG